MCPALGGLLVASAVGAGAGSFLPDGIIRIAAAVGRSPPSRRRQTRHELALA